VRSVAVDVRFLRFQPTQQVLHASREGNLGAKVKYLLSQGCVRVAVANVAGPVALNNLGLDRLSEAVGDDLGRL
jgi:hypothetical protein